MTDVWVYLAKLFCRLPLSWQMCFGRGLGWLFWILPNSRKKVVRTNIKACFAHMATDQQDQLVRDNLIATGQGVVEMMAALWSSDRGLERRFSFSGLEHLLPVLEQGQGVLLLSCHTTSIEWGIKGLNAHLRSQGLPVGHMLAREHNNKKLEAHYQKARLQFVEKVIDKKDIRSLLKSVKKGHGVYYAPDQHFSYNHEMIEFFGVPAATTLGPAKITESKGIAAIPWFCFRQGKGHWHIEVCPPIPAMGTEQHVLALQQMNQLFEEKIKQHPAQYLWAHRRFKHTKLDGKPFYEK